MTIVIMRIFKQAIALNACEYLYPNAQNIAAFLYRIKREFPANYHDIVTTIQTVSPFFHDFYLMPAGDPVNEKNTFKNGYIVIMTGHFQPINYLMEHHVLFAWQFFCFNLNS
jgi:Predicted ATPase